MSFSNRSHGIRHPEQSEGSPRCGSMPSSGDPSSQAPRDDGIRLKLTPLTIQGIWAHIYSNRQI